MGHAALRSIHKCRTVAIEIKANSQQASKDYMGLRDLLY